MKTQIAMIGFDLTGVVAGGMFVLNHAQNIYLISGAISFVVSAIIKLISKKKQQ
jgi:anaerobic C4-dicarboxylate transporter